MRMRWQLMVGAAVAMMMLLAACGAGAGAGNEAAEGDGAQTAGAAAGTEAAANADGAEGLTDVSFRLDWVISGEHSHFYAALDEGFFEEEGLNVEIFEGGGSALATQLVANQTNDFGLADFGVVVSSRAEGVNAVTVANLFQETPHALMTLEGKGIDSAEDLKGKRIGGAAGSGAVVLFSPYLESVGMSIDDVNMVQLDPAAYIPSLYEGRIDGFPGSRISQYPQLVVSAPEPPTLIPFSEGLDLASMGLIAHPDMVANEPETVRAFVRAIQRAIEWTVDNPEDAIENMTQRFPNTVDAESAEIAIGVLKELAVDGLDEGQPIGYLPPERAENTLATLIEYGGLDEADVVGAEEYYTNDFVEE